jgi:hypothetical protein
MDESLLISVNLRKALGDRHSYVANETASRLSLEFFKHSQLGSLVAKVHFGAESEGPPGLAHGAAVSGALLEAMIFGAWSQGHAVLSMRMSTTFKQMMPINATAFIETHLEIEGPRITIRATMTAQSGETTTLFAESEGTFMAIPAAKFGVDGQKVAQMFAALS